MDSEVALEIEMGDVLDDAVREIKGGSLSDETRDRVSKRLIEELNLAVDDVEGIEDALVEEVETPGETTLYRAGRALRVLVETVERTEESDERTGSLLNEQALRALRYAVSTSIPDREANYITFDRLIVADRDEFRFTAGREDEFGREEWNGTMDTETVFDNLRTVCDGSDYDAQAIIKAIEAVFEADDELTMEHFTTETN